MLEFNDIDMKTNGEYHTDAYHYKRKLEVLGIDEEEIMTMMIERALIGNVKAIDMFTLIMGEEEAEAHLEEVINQESEEVEE